MKMKKNYIKMMKMELEDVRLDINLLIKKDKKHHDKGELTNYVYRENIAVYNSFILGLELFIKLLNETKTDKFGNLEAMTSELNRLFHEKVKEHGLADGIHSLVERKIKKVIAYVTEKQTS